MGYLLTSSWVKGQILITIRSADWLCSNLVTIYMSDEADLEEIASEKKSMTKMNFSENESMAIMTF